MFSHLTLLSFLKIMKSFFRVGKGDGEERLRTKNSSGKLKTYEIFIRSFITAFFHLFFFLHLKRVFHFLILVDHFPCIFFLFVKLKTKSREIW